MATINHLATKLFLSEGLFNNVPSDHGGPTNRGVTLSTWRNVGYDKDGDSDIDIEDIRLLTTDDAFAVLKKHYWDRWHADEIGNQRVADILVDWVWCSGKWGIIIPQRILRKPADGIVGPATLKAVNSANPYQFLIQVYNARVAFIVNLIRKDPSLARFERGWYNRLNTYL
ncbi:MAG: glycosyl hydrolase 108 family protein [Bacteroidales bacterium]|nr:glycosyl hydrolase 108 family protein [Bacteroidales bacterium]